MSLTQQPPGSLIIKLKLRPTTKLSSTEEEAYRQPTKAAAWISFKGEVVKFVEGNPTVFSEYFVIPKCVETKSEPSLRAAINEIFVQVESQSAVNLTMLHPIKCAIQKWYSIHTRLFEMDAAKHDDGGELTNLLLEICSGMASVYMHFGTLNCENAHAKVLAHFELYSASSFVQEHVGRMQCEKLREKIRTGFAAILKDWRAHKNIKQQAISHYQQEHKEVPLDVLIPVLVPKITPKELCQRTDLFNKDTRSEGNNILFENSAKRTELVNKLQAVTEKWAGMYTIKNKSEANDLVQQLGLLVFGPKKDQDAVEWERYPAFMREIVYWTHDGSASKSEINEQQIYMNHNQGKPGVTYNTFTADERYAFEKKELSCGKNWKNEARCSK